MAKTTIPAQFARFCTPAVLADGEHFLIKVAENSDEIARAQKLRYDVFKEEQGRLGRISQAQAAAKIDADVFDNFCLHLIVIEKSSGRIVGTYRVHPGCVAKNGIGFYSEGEYSISNLAKYSDELLEYGRSCVAPEYRNGAVVSLLWAGIGELHSRSRMRYLMGCVSLESVDPVVGWAIYKHALGMVRPTTPPPVQATAKAEYVLSYPGDKAVADYIDAHRGSLQSEMPPLLKGYLRLGAYLAGEPALDSDFGAIDIFIWLDLANTPPRYTRHFMRIPF